MRLPTKDDYRCCGCGQAALDEVKPCNCVTMVGARDGVDGRRQYVVLKTQKQARREALSALIRERILGVRPEDQDLVLEDEDWMEIVAALEGDRP